MKYQNIRTEKKKGCGRKGISLLMAGTMAVSMLPAVPANAAELAEPTSAAVELAGREKAESGSLESLLAEENETSDPAVSAEPETTTAAETTTSSAEASSESTEAPSTSGSTAASSEAPTETQPVTADPSQTLPAETQPAETQPSETLPGETTPAESTTAAPVLVVQQPPLDLEALRAAMPVNQSSIRTELALSAYSLVGQVGYFWGGKSTVLGWDPLWGTVMQVTIDGSQSTGTFRSYGLDCSGFVGWVYVNAFQDPSILGSLGSVTSEQWANSDPVDWSDAMVGDLVFRRIPSATEQNHVGIIVDRDANGNVKIAHCSSGSNNVIVEEGQAGFPYVRRPRLMSGECSCTTQIGNVIIHDASCKEYSGTNTDVNASDPLIWDTKEQLIQDLGSMFPDAALAEAVSDALWDTYAERRYSSVWEQALLTNGADISFVNMALDLFHAPQEKHLNLNTLGYERLDDFVKSAQIVVNAQGESEEERLLREAEQQQIQERINAGEDIQMPEYDIPDPVVSIQGIEYLQSAKEINLENNQITSLAPLDYDTNGVYHWSVYYEENGVWVEDPDGELHEAGEISTYFGGGLPGTREAYATYLDLKNNPIEEIPENTPGRLVICNIQKADAGAAETETASETEAN